MRPPKITFDAAPNKCYLPGDTVSGFVYLNLKEPLGARFLEISWAGFTKTELPLKFPHCGNGSSSKIIHFNDWIFPWKSENGVNMLPAGPHKFSFSFQLPQDLPPSFDGKFGYVRYTVCVEINRVLALDSITFKDFTVGKLCVLDPEVTNNDEDSLTVSLAYMARNLFFEQGLVEMEITSLENFYNPGSDAKFEILFKNHSSTDINRIRVSLYQKVHYQTKPTEYSSTGWYKNQKILLEDDYFDTNVRKWSEKNVKLEVNIPKDTTPSFESPLITVAYYWVVKVSRRGFLDFPMMAKYDIVIGDHLENKKEEKKPTNDLDLDSSDLSD